MNRIVLAHSGGLQTLVGIPWLAARRRAEVVTVTLDIGQRPSLEDIHERALAMGAARAHVIDARERFAREFVVPALGAHTASAECAPLMQSLALAAIAKHAVEIAHIEGAGAIAFGGADATMDALLQDLDPAIKRIALPAAGTAAWEDAMAHARLRGVPLPAPADAVPVTKSATVTPDLPAFVEIEFDGGVPVRINDVEMPLVDLMLSLETIAGAHGVGRPDIADVAEHRWSPVAHVLQRAHADLQRVVDLGDSREEDLSGVVRLRLFKGDCGSAGARPQAKHVPSPLALVESASR